MPPKYKNKAPQLILLSLGYLAVEVNGDNGELSCQKCESLTYDLCSLVSGKRQSRCDFYAADNWACRLSCNQCPRVIEYFCSYSTPDSDPDDCKASMEQVCQKTNSKGQFPCSECNELLKVCEYFSPQSQLNRRKMVPPTQIELKKRCIFQAKRYCDIICKDCKGMAEIYCSYPPMLPYFDACTTLGEQVCLSKL